jgi:hypothetical protein
LLLKHRPDDASLVAARRADELPTEGDIEGQIVWGASPPLLPTFSGASAWTRRAAELSPS